MQPVVLLGILAIISQSCVQASESCFALDACRRSESSYVFYLGISCCYDKYRKQVCKLDKGDYDDYLADSNRGVDIAKVLCSQPAGKMKASEFYNCYKGCGVNKQFIDTCQNEVYGGPLNLEDTITKKICNGKPGSVASYMDCLKDEYNNYYGTTNGTVELKAQVIQVNYCQARELGIIFDEEQLLNELFGL